MKILATILLLLVLFCSTVVVYFSYTKDKISLVLSEEAEHGAASKEKKEWQESDTFNTVKNSLLDSSIIHRLLFYQAHLPFPVFDKQTPPPDTRC